MIWGGGDGSSDVNTGRGEAGADAAGAGMGAAGAAGMGQMGQGMSEDEEIYGRQPDQPGRAPATYTDAEGEEKEQWGDEVMQDPWSEAGGGGDGDWGDWGDSF